MEKNAIKKYAVWARNELIARVSQKAQQYGITAEGYGDKNADSINGVLLSATVKKQRQALIAKIEAEGFEQVMEEVAYTWFNRFTALRFMEVNNYLPSHTRVFTNEANEFKPQILTDAISLELEGLDMDKVFELKDENKDEELYKYLLIVQCNALSSILPGMFQKIEDYTELLLPDNLLRQGSVIEQMIFLVPEMDWKEAVQIIGWLYQYYNSEKKDDVFAALKKNEKITKENIPAATQLFTPDWIVRYMVENSLGRLWLEGHPDAKDQLLPTHEEQSAYDAGNRDPEDAKWHYYLEEAEQEPEVQDKLSEIRKEYAALTPDQIKVIDPCCGSGHILVYMFDVLMQIYEVYGYSVREAVRSIVENNIYGLDIDDRAAQLAYFAVMMKARQYDRRFLIRMDEDDNPDVPQPHVYAIMESNHLDQYAIEYFVGSDPKLNAALNTIIRELHGAKEYGSILTVTPQDWSSLYWRFEEITKDIDLSREVALRELLPLVQVAEALAQKYDVVVTNPPYMSSSNMGNVLLKFIKANYPEGKNDLFSAFMQKCLALTKLGGFSSMITMHSWMFLSRYQSLRLCLLNYCIENILHLGARAFDDIGGEVVQTASFVIRKTHLSDYIGRFEKLTEYGDADLKIQNFRSPDSTYYCHQKNYSFMVDNIIAYWISERLGYHFSSTPLLGTLVDCRQGIATGNNDIFLRLWHEVCFGKINFLAESQEDMVNSGKLYAPYNKGGSFRRWFGNREYVIKMDSYNYDLLLTMGNHLPSRQYYYCRGITWNDLSTALFCARYVDKGFVFDAAGPSCFYEGNEKYLLGLLNSNVAQAFLNVICQGLHYSTGHIPNIPFIKDREGEVSDAVDGNLSISKMDWDSFETSWDFQRHPLIAMIPKGGAFFEGGRILLSECYGLWEAECNECFNHLKSNEEELNRIFIDIYGLQDELTPEVEDKDVTVRKADLGRDIRSFISYSVGCMFGRYSLDEPGLAYAGGEWSADKYKAFPADKDNIIPICDDEYFEDDIVGRFVKFVETVYGADALEENLRFIADALGGKSSSRDVIRNYFINDFYADHLKMYQKRPIYWLFDSGKKNGFKCLIYMHRYQPDTIARIRTDYVHEQQSRYRTTLVDLEQRINSASTSERVKLNKQLKTIQNQAEELRQYEEKIHHLADQMISINLDDGVKENYAKFQDVLAKIK